MKLTATPMEHQHKFLEFSKEHDFTLCGDQMGLGKTLEAIMVSVDGNYNTLVVCPAFLKHNWKAEFLKFTDLEEDEIAIDKIVNSKHSSRLRVVITSYSRLKNAAGFFKWADHVIADEAHYLKNMAAARTGQFHKGIKTALPKKLTLLTGTAVKNRVDEFYSLLYVLSYCPSGKNGLKITDKYITQYSFSNKFSYKRTFTLPSRRVEITKFEGLRNEAELRTYFKGKYIRRLTKDVIVLPELLHKYVEVDYAYDDTELKEAYESFTGKKDGHIMALKRGSAVAKSPFTAVYAKNIHEESGQPVVIFSDHIDSVDLIAAKLGKGVGVIKGSTPMPERHSIVESFQSGQLDYLVATIGAASTGLTLTASSDLVFNDMSYVPANNKQASARIHRIGQEKTCRVHKICGSFIDRMIMTSLTSKEKIIDKIL